MAAENQSVLTTRAADTPARTILKQDVSLAMWAIPSPVEIGDAIETKVKAQQEGTERHHIWQYRNTKRSEEDPHSKASEEAVDDSLSSTASLTYRIRASELGGEINCFRHGYLT